MHISEATSARTLNEALNNTFGTQNVTYADAWPMDIHNGTEYMNQYYASVGRKYAEQVLEHRATAPCCMSTMHAHHEMTDRQRAALSHLAETTDSQQFTSSLRACVKNGALTSTSLLLLQPQRFVPAPVKLAEPVEHMEPAEVAPMVVDEVAASTASPTRLQASSPAGSPAQVQMSSATASPAKLQLNSPAISNRSIKLQAKPKRRKPNK